MESNQRMNVDRPQGVCNSEMFCQQMMLMNGATVLFDFVLDVSTGLTRYQWNQKWKF